MPFTFSTSCHHGHVADKMRRTRPNSRIATVHRMLPIPKRDFGLLIHNLHFIKRNSFISGMQILLTHLPFRNRADRLWSATVHPWLPPPPPDARNQMSQNPPGRPNRLGQARGFEDVINFTTLPYHSLATENRTGRNIWCMLARSL